MDEKITIKINEKGELEMKTDGILGPTCVNEVNSLLEDIAYATEYIKTDEYYMDSDVKAKEIQKIKRN